MAVGEGDIRRPLGQSKSAMSPITCFRSANSSPTTGCSMSGMSPAANAADFRHLDVGGDTVGAEGG
jgi:hypothetical protein